MIQEKETNGIGRKTQEQVNHDVYFYNIFIS